MADEIEIGVKVNGLAQIKSDLKALKSELINATDPAEIERLSMAAGQLSDKISDANEKIKVFAAGSSFESVGNGLGLIGNQLSSLDFEGAQESAKMLTATITNMNPKAVMDGFKAFIGTIGELSKAFVQMGLKLLANPLFLLVAVVAAVVIAIVLLKDKIGIMQKAFDLLMIPIKLVIQTLKDLTDWLGLTAFAAEDSASRQIAASNRTTQAIRNNGEKAINALNREIAVKKAAGQDTTNLEKKVLDESTKISKANIKNAQDETATILALSAAKNEKLTKDQLKTIRDNNTLQFQEIENVKNFNNEKKVLDVAYAKDASDKQKSANDKASADQKAADQKATEDKKARLKREADLQQKYSDEIKALGIKTEEEKLAFDKQKEIREINQMDISAKAKEARLKDVNTKYGILESQLVQDQADKLKEIVANNELEIAKIKDGSRNAELNRQRKAELAAIDKITQDETAKQEAKKAVEDKYKLLKRDADALDFAEAQSKELEKNENDLITFEEKFIRLDEQQKRLNENELLNKAERDAAQLELDEKRTQAEADFEMKKEEAIASTKQNFQNIISGIEQTGLAKTKAGQIAMKAIALAQIGIDSAMALSKASTLANAEGVAAQLAFPMVPGAGTIARVISYASTALSVGANIAKAKKLLSSGGSPSASGGSGGGGSVGGGGGSSAPTAPSFELYGKNNEANTATSAKSVEAQQANNITVTAVVSETEITSTQDRVARMNSSGEL